DGVNDFLKLLRRVDIRKEEDLGDLLLIIAALVRIIHRDENGARRERLPIRLGEHAEIVKGFLQRGALEINRDVATDLGLILGIPDDGKTRQRGDRLKKQFGS